MNDLHATPSFKALDEGRLQPVDNDTDTGALLPVTPLPDPLRMPWEDLRDALWERFKDDERDDDELCVSRAEACSLLGWASHFDREAQPRRDDEEKSFAIIQKAAELLRPADGEVIFSLRISGDHSSLQTSAGKGVEPHTVLSKAIETLEAERKDAAGCPAHRHQSETGAALTRDGREADCDLCGNKRVVQDGIDIRSYPETAPCPKCRDGSWALKALRMKPLAQPVEAGEDGHD